MLFSRHRVPSLSSDSSPSSSYDDISSYATSEDDEYRVHIRERERQRREELQREWEEGMEQLRTLLLVVLMPWIGKFYGRKCAHACKYSVL